LKVEDSDHASPQRTKYLNALSQGNRNLRRQGEFRPERIAERDALCIVLTNISEGTGQTENVTLYTTLLRKQRVNPFLANLCFRN
jgi:hypothetical protein